ncbi:MAG: FecR family protein [bacterium]|nr:FecR family protein [bacterium]
MKKLAIVLLLLYLIFVTTVFGANNIAITYKVKGNVELYRAGSKTPEVLAPSVHLNDGDRIKTSADGYAFIIFIHDKSQVKIRENSDLTLSVQKEGASVKQQINLDIGKVWTQVSKSGGNVRIATPTSVASVKGTTWWTILDEKGDTYVIGIEGLVELYNRITGQSVTVGSGQTGRSNQSGVTVSQTTGSIPNSEGTGQINRIVVPFRDSEGNERNLIIEVEE